MKNVYQEHGFAMLLVIFTTVLISVIGLGLLTMNANSVKTSKNEEVDQSVYYIAEAGLNYGLLEIETEVNQVYKEFLEDFNLANKEIKKGMIDNFPENLYVDIEATVLNMHPSFNDFKNDEAEASVYTKKHTDISQNSRKYEVVSTGKINKKERIVSQIITIEIPGIGDGDGDGDFENEVGKYAVHTSGNITVSGSASINGPIATQNGVITINSPNSLSSTDKIGVNHVSMPGWFTIPNELIGPQPLPTEILRPFPDNEITNLNNALTYSVGLPYPPIKKVPPKNLDLIDDKGNFNLTSSGNYNSNYSIDLTDSMRFNTFHVGDSKTITIDIGNSDKNLYLKKLDNQGTINVIGSGKLNIYVEDFNAKNGALNAGNNGDLNIYAKSFVMGGWKLASINNKNTGNLGIYIKDSATFSGDSSINKGGDPSRTSIYYASTTAPKLPESEQSEISSNFYVKSANLTIGGSLNFIGNLYSGGNIVDIGGAMLTNSLNVYAPNASVKIDGSREVKGEIISKDFIAAGNSRITFGETTPNNGSEIPTGSVFKKPNIELNFMVEK